DPLLRGQKARHELAKRRESTALRPRGIAPHRRDQGRAAARRAARKDQGSAERAAGQPHADREGLAAAVDTPGGPPRPAHPPADHPSGRARPLHRLRLPFDAPLPAAQPRRRAVGRGARPPSVRSVSAPVPLTDSEIFWFGTAASVLAGLGTTVGALAVFLLRRPSERVMIALISGAAGIMLAASFFSLLQPAFEYARARTAIEGAGLLSVVAGVFVGALALYLVHRFSPHEHFD